VGYSPGGRRGGKGVRGGGGEGGGGREWRGRLGSLVCTVARSLASVLLLARILIDFENTIFCANDQNAALAACYSGPVPIALCLVRRVCLHHRHASSVWFSVLDRARGFAISL